MSIKNEFEQVEKLYHFTSFDTALKILDSNRLKFGKLTNMNDIHENDKVTFVDTTQSRLTKFPSDILDTLYDEIYKYRQISLTVDNNETGKKGFDLHQMWGLYANKGEGVCLVFDKNKLLQSLNVDIYHQHVDYKDTGNLDSFVVSNSQNDKEVITEIRNHVQELFFYKRKEWEHEQEYRLLKRCPNPNCEEYLSFGQTLKFIVLSSKLRNQDEVLYFKRIETLNEKVKKIEKDRNVGDNGKIHILVYGNGLFDYTLGTGDGDEEIWNAEDGFDTLIIGINCHLSL